MKDIKEYINEALLTEASKDPKVGTVAYDYYGQEWTIKAAAKTNNKGKHRKAYGNYYPSKNWSITNQKKIDSLNEQIEENNNEVD